MSATGYLDACGFIPASSGTGNFVVSAAVQGYQTPAAAGAVNSTVYSYRAESSDKTQWEEGFGAYTVSGTTLARTTITANSSGGTTAINFSAAPNVFITALSQDLQNASMLASGTLPAARLGMPIVRASVQFSGGASAATINGTPFNVSSITRNGTGDYTINLTNPAPDANYSYSVTTGPSSGGVSLNAVACRNGSSGAYVAPTASALRVNFFETFVSGTAADPANVSVVIFE